MGKVLFVHEGYIVRKNSEYYSSAYNNEIVERYKVLGEHVTFLTREEPYSDKITKYNKIDTVNFDFIGVYNLKTFKGLIKYKQIFKAIEDAVIENDYIVARLPGSLGNIAVGFARKHQKKYIVELVGCPWDAYWNYSNIGKFVAPIEYIKTKKIIRNSMNTLYITQEFLQKRYPCHNNTIICSDVALNDTEQVVLQNRIEKINQHRKPIVLGTIAPVNVKYKGQQYVIKAISELCNMGYDYEYQLVGGGDSRYLMEIAKRYGIADRVKFIGTLPHKQIFNWIDNIDIYIQPSTAESFGRVNLEAMSRGCPILVARTGGMPELVDSSYIFEKRNVKSIVRKIEKMQSDDMRDQALRNFSFAKEFLPGKLDIIRNNFFEGIKKNSIF